MNCVTIILGSIASLIFGFIIALFIPGFERKIHARIQQRIGPPITTPGLWNILKFYNKKTVVPKSDNPIAYHLTLIFALASVIFAFLFTTPFWWNVLGFASILGIAGLLKLEEISYLVMGTLSRSVMSVGMPANDITLYAKFSKNARRYFEEVGALRALKMVTYGSFPFYIALFLPFMVSQTMYIEHVVFAQNPQYSLIGLKPIILTFSGILAGFVYFIGFNILLNNRPFDIIKPKVDIIEGPILEYAAVYRGLYYFLVGFLSFTLSSIFVTLFFGIPLDLTVPSLTIAHLALIFILPFLSAILRAFSPVLTFTQIHYVSLLSTIIGVLALFMAAFGL